MLNLRKIIPVNLFAQLNSLQNNGIEILQRDSLRYYRQWISFDRKLIATSISIYLPNCPLSIAAGLDVRSQ